MSEANIAYKRIILIFTFLLASLIFGAGLLNHYFFRTFAFDYAAYNFAWFDYAHFRISPNPIYFYPNMSFFQDHFSFTLIFLAPLYWIFSPIFGTYSLLIIQDIFILIGAWAIYKLIKLKSDNDIFSLLAIALYFATYGRFAALITDCNLEIMLSSLIPLFLYFFEKEKYKHAFIVFLFLILGRENFPLWFVFIGLFLIYEHRKDRKKRNISIALITFSIIYFFLLFKVFIPLTESPDRPYSLFNYSALGENPYEAIIFILKHPIDAIKLLFVNPQTMLPDKIKLEFYWVYFISGGFVLLFRPKYILWFIPIIAQKMYNDAIIRWSIESYYSIEIVTLLPLAVFLTLNEINFKINYKNLTTNKAKTIIGSAIVLFAFIITIHKLDISNRQLKWYEPEKNVFFKKNIYKPNYNAKKIHKYLKVIPDTASVSAYSTIAPHLAFRQKIYFFPKINDAQYIAILQNKKTFNFKTYNDFANAINKYIFSDDWDIIIDDFPFILLKHQTDSVPLKKLISCNFDKIDSNSNLIIGNNISFSQIKRLSTKEFHSPKYSLKLSSNDTIKINIKCDIGDHIEISLFYKNKIEIFPNFDKYKKIQYNSRNWQHATYNLLICNKLTNDNLTLFIQNPEQKPAFIDNLKIKIK